MSNKNVRFELTEKEKLAKAAGANIVVGLGNNATTVSADEQAKNQLSKEESSRLNTMVEEFNANWEEYEKQMRSTTGDLSKYKNLEIKPIGNYVLVKPFEFNPFRKIERDANGLIVSGFYSMKDLHLTKNSDTGNFEEEEQYIFTGAVQEVGPECKWIIPGDIIQWTKPSQVPVPFYKQGCFLVNETRAISIINDYLSERLPKSPSEIAAEEFFKRKREEHASNI